ncbi:MAG: WD40 repeat domain-containing serine/threonine protein kinase [Aggregatilineales bacterium]
MIGLVGQRLGQYEVIAQLGEGGMGAVYRAHQPSMGRDVAIKVIAGHLSAQNDFTVRFEREVRLCASLSHAHIIKVFDFGRDPAAEMDYLVMELLTGGNLSGLIRKGPLPLEMIDRLLDQIASALDYAHRKDIVHRDLKPLNVLLDEGGNAYLSDFGLAKLRSDAVALTQSGIALGTWGYMAPEQWRGQTLDGRADLYALGVLLFEMLTGQLPFHGETVEALLYQHLFEPPARLTSLRPDAPLAMSEILAHALEKDRDNRYSLASALAADFRAALTGSSYSVPVFRPDPAHSNARIFSGVSITPSDDLSDRTRLGQTVPVSLSTAATPAPIVPPLDVSEAMRLATIATLSGHERPVTLIAFHPDGRLLISCDLGKAIRIWDVGAGREVRRLIDYTTWEVSGLAFSPDGRTLALGGHTLIFKNNRDWTSLGAALLWALDGEQTMWQMPESRHIRDVLAVGFSVGGQLLLVSDGVPVGLWELADEQLIRIAELSHEHPIRCAAFSANGRWLATGEGSAIHLWNIETGQPARSLSGHSDRVQMLVFSPDGRLLASVGHNPVLKTTSVYLWQTTNGQQELALTEQTNAVRSAAISPDGALLATGHEDGSIQLWDTVTGKAIKTLLGHDGEIHSLVFNPDGQLLASGSYDRTVRIWGTP